MLDSANRLTIPSALMEQSNLKGEKKVYITVENGDIHFIPYSQGAEGHKVFDVRSLDAKRRITLPTSFVKVSSDWEVYLLNGEIWATRLLL